MPANDESPASEQGRERDEQAQSETDSEGGQSGRPDFYDREVHLRKNLADAAREFHNADVWNDESTSPSALRDAREKYEHVAEQAQAQIEEIESELNSYE